METRNFIWTTHRLPYFYPKGASDTPQGVEGIIGGPIPSVCLSTVQGELGTGGMPESEIPDFLIAVLIGFPIGFLF